MTRIETSSDHVIKLDVLENKIRSCSQISLRAVEISGVKHLSAQIILGQPVNVNTKQDIIRDEVLEVIGAGSWRAIRERVEGSVLIRPTPLRQQLAETPRTETG